MKILSIHLIGLFISLTLSLSSIAQCTSYFTYTTSGNMVSVSDGSNLTPGIGKDFYWNFGDGYIYTTQNKLSNFQHTYSGNGTFIVCLTISDSIANCTDVYCDTVTVNGPPAPCNANFTHSTNGNTATFMDISSIVTGSGNSFHWDFGDGFIYNSSSKVINYTHAYNTSGTYQVCLTIQDSLWNCSDVYCDTVSVAFGTAQCNANFTDSVYGYTLYVSDLSNPVSNNKGYHWDFGDGYTTVSSSQFNNYYHTYSSQGLFNVCLTVVDSFNNCVDTMCKTISTVYPCDANYKHEFSGPYTVDFFSNSTSSGMSPKWVYNDGKGWGYSTSNSSNFQVTPWFNVFSADYKIPGTYYPYHAIVDTSTNCYDTVYIPITIPGNNGNCASTLNYSQNSRTVTFSTTGSTTSNSNAYYFDTGDLGFILNRAYYVTAPNQTITYTYGPSSAQYYVACFTAIDSLTNCYAISCDTIWMGSSLACQAGFVKSQAVDSNNLPIPGHVVITDISVGNNLTYSWNFGDGTTSTLTNPTHTYSGNGPYILCLTVTDTNCVDTYCDTLSVDSNGIVSKGSPGFTIHVGGYNPGTGIQKISKLDLNMYPNPVTDELYIDIKGLQEENAELTLLNGLGQEVLPMQLIEAGRNEHVKVDLSSLERGLYFIQLIHSQERLVKKVIKY